jgi:hypothetical protein
MSTFHPPGMKSRHLFHILFKNHRAGMCGLRTRPSADQESAYFCGRGSNFAGCSGRGPKSLGKNFFISSVDVVKRVLSINCCLAVCIRHRYNRYFVC